AGGSVAAERIGVVVDGSQRFGGRVAGDAVSVVRLGPAPEAAQLAVHRVDVSRHVALVPAGVLGDGNGVARAVDDLRDLGAGQRFAGVDVQSAVGPGRFIAQAGDRVDVRVAGGAVIGEAVALGILRLGPGVAGANIGFDNVAGGHLVS